MTNSLTIQLLNETLSLPDITIDQAMDIALIPQDFNEKRLSAMITHLSGDAELAGRLTAHERYYILLSHQSVMQSTYSEEVGNDDYLLNTVQSNVPQNARVGELLIHHLRGAHVCVLEGICENVYDWLRGQMACQLSGSLATSIGGDDDAFVWDELTAGMTDAELKDVIQARVSLIGSLSTDQFNALVEHYNVGVNQLEHFVSLGTDNSGLTVIKQGGDGAGMPARFLTLDTLQGAALTLAECLDERRFDHDGTRQNELA